MTDTETDAMTDKSIQAWLDGELDKKPAVSESELTAYEKLYLALQEQPEERLAPGFAARVTARIQQVEDSTVRPNTYTSVCSAIASAPLMPSVTDLYYVSAKNLPFQNCRYLQSAPLNPPKNL